MAKKNDKNDKTAKEQFKKAKTKKKPSAKKEQPYTGGTSICGTFPRRTPGWIRREQW